MARSSLLEPHALAAVEPAARVPRRRSSLGAKLAAVLLVGVTAGLLLDFGSTREAPGLGVAGAVPSHQPVSPLLFGTNLGLFTVDDQFVSNARTRQLLTQIHVQFIRMPYRDTVPESLEIEAMQLIKSLGATPSVVIRGPTHLDLAIDVHQLQVIQSVFGESTVYIDFGNEDDLNPEQYAAAWNMVIPTLKGMAPSYQFGGPAAIVYDPAKTAYLLAHGRPQPDFIVWHEYTCDRADTQQHCLEAIKRWPIHIRKTRDALIAADAKRGASIPLIIDEWNYAPNPLPLDGKSNDPAFMRQWTTEAIQTLADNGIFASAQYVATNHEDFELISPSRLLTPQAQTFGDMYERLILNCRSCTTP